MQIGDKVPEVLGVDQEGREWRMSDFSGRKVILYFYPKDSTPRLYGRSLLFARSFRRIAGLGLRHLGRKRRFGREPSEVRRRPVLALPPHCRHRQRLIEPWAYGARKSLRCITVGLLRTTFLIDEQGCVERIFTPGQIRTKIHAEQILKPSRPKPKADFRYTLPWPRHNARRWHRKPPHSNTFLSLRRFFFMAVCSDWWVASPFSLQNVCDLFVGLSVSDRNVLVKSLFRELLMVG